MKSSKLITLRMLTSNVEKQNKKLIRGQLSQLGLDFPNFQATRPPFFFHCRCNNISSFLIPFFYSSSVSTQNPKVPPHNGHTNARPPPLNHHHKGNYRRPPSTSSNSNGVPHLRNNPRFLLPLLASNKRNSALLYIPRESQAPRTKFRVL